MNQAANAEAPARSAETIVVDDPGQDVKVVLTVSNDSSSAETFALHRGSVGFTADASNRIANIQSNLDAGEFFTFALTLRDGQELAALCGTNDAINVTYDEFRM